jgi:hypothetical protein
MEYIANLLFNRVQLILEGVIDFMVNFHQCLRTLLGEIDRAYVTVLGEPFGSPCRIDQITASVSCQ